MTFGNNLQADITLIEADEIDCSGQRPSLITGRAPSEITAQQAQLPLLRTLISRSRECIGLVADAEAVHCPSCLLNAWA